jgi:beta-phosphoglucomutase
MPAWPIKACIFDLDGVLADTASLHLSAWRRLAADQGWPFDESLADRTRGVSRAESLRLVMGDQQVDERTFAELMEQKNAYYLDQVKRLTPNDLLPGARELLGEIRAAGLKWAVASASKNARAVLDRLGLLQLVHAVSDGYAVERTKPAPDLFLHAAGQLGVPAGHCVVFEDAESGVAAALAAGMWCVGIGPADRVGQAHVRWSSLSGAHLAGILDALAAQR